LSLDHHVQQPPVFPDFYIPPCPRDKKFSHTLLPPFVKIPFTKPGTTEMYYKSEDGRKAATSLMNPMAFPSTDWNAQIQKWETGDQFGNNLNMFGCWWSLRAPDDPELEKEIKIFKERWMKTAQELIAAGETLNAQGNRKDISPLMHFAMDYMGLQAPWHMASVHRVACPNCGELVNEGISYHKNEFGERCIIDMERYLKSVPNTKIEGNPHAEKETVLARTEEAHEESGEEVAQSKSRKGRQVRARS
jgi:hypothetical protein